MHLGKIPTNVNAWYKVLCCEPLTAQLEHTLCNNGVYFAGSHTQNDIICAISNKESPCLKIYTQIFICKQTDSGRICRSNLIFHFECCKEYLYVSDCVMAIIMNKVMLFPYWQHNANQKTSDRYLNNNLHDVLCLLSFCLIKVSSLKWRQSSLKVKQQIK